MCCSVDFLLLSRNSLQKDNSHTATHCNTLQHTTHLFYSALQCVAACCSVCCSVLQCVLHYVLQCDAVCVAGCCRVLQCVAVCCGVCCSLLQCVQCVPVCCSMLQCAALRCSVLQRVAACCSVLQRVAVRRPSFFSGKRELFDHRTHQNGLHIRNMMLTPENFYLQTTQRERGSNFSKVSLLQNLIFKLT